VHFSELILEPRIGPRQFRLRDRVTPGADLAEQMSELAQGGGLAQFARIAELVTHANLLPRDLLGSRLSFDMICRMYKTLMPHASFIQFYWAWRSLFGGLFSILTFDLPKANIYHAISTGYAGLLAARAGLQAGQHVLLTEHGIYTNERRIEMLIADWIA